MSGEQEHADRSHPARLSAEVSHDERDPGDRNAPEDEAEENARQDRRVRLFSSRAERDDPRDQRDRREPRDARRRKREREEKPGEGGGEEQLSGALPPHPRPLPACGEGWPRGRGGVGSKAAPPPPGRTSGRTAPRRRAGIPSPPPRRGARRRRPARRTRRPAGSRATGAGTGRSSRCRRARRAGASSSSTHLVVTSRRGPSMRPDFVVIAGVELLRRGENAERAVDPRAAPDLR